MEELEVFLSQKGLTVSTLPEKGRCLFTARDFSPGEVILSQEPYVCIPNKNSSGSSSKCDWCFNSSNIKKCSACQVVWYCSSTCQKSDWQLHRLECQVLSKIDKDRIKSLTPSIRLMVKLYLRRKLQSEKVIPVTATDNYNLVNILVSHMSDVDEKQLVLYAQMANLVKLILHWPESEINVKEIAVNFSKLACNAHTISDAELRPLGTGLYPVISIINHSCLPNSVLVFDGRSAVVRALEPMAKGTEVLISYIETAGSTITRQKALKEQYFFTCTCPHCIQLGEHDDIQERAILEGYRCRDDTCTGFLLRDSDNKGFICQQCGRLREKEEITNAVNEVNSLSKRVSLSESTGNNTNAISVYKAIEKLQMKLFHPFSINLLRTRETLLKTFMEIQELREALEYCRLVLPVYQRVYPRYHPLLGLQYYTCGKLEWYLVQTEEAVQSLSKAVDILRITHGASTPFIRDLLMKLEEARAEASYNLSSKTDEE